MTTDYATLPADIPVSEAISRVRQEAPHKETIYYVFVVDPEATPPDPIPQPRNEPAEPSRVCPNCGAPLLEQKCKLLCPNRECGYYLSCSDFY